MNTPAADYRTATVLRLRDLTGNSKSQIRQKAWREARRCFGPDARIEVNLDRHLSDNPPARLNTTDRFFASHVEVRAVESTTRPTVNENEGTGLTLSDLTGNTKREIELAAYVEALRCFGRQARIQVEFKCGLSDDPPARLNTTDRFFASFVQVRAVESIARPTVNEDEGTLL
ncbi:hypothetical protein, partial [Actinoallomurus sp. NPDC052274]|uniref:hypothetical protein n=1 Tax=Actinoallomurus sp. NPDC052274 TaxID=3155420 RepID=UPI00343F24BE